MYLTGRLSENQEPSAIFVRLSDKTSGRPSFPVDAEGWLDGLDDRPRAVAEQLLSGLNTVEVARMHGVSRMMVYFIRQHLVKAWKDLFGEEASDSLHGICTERVSNHRKRPENVEIGSTDTRCKTMM